MPSARVRHVRCSVGPTGEHTGAIRTEGDAADVLGLHVESNERVAGAGVPYARWLLREINSSDLRPIGAEGAATGDPWIAGQVKELLTAGRIPDARGPVLTDRQNAVAVRGIHAGPDPVRVSAQR